MIRKIATGIIAVGMCAMLLGALGFTLPDQPPPKISTDAAVQKTEV